MTTNKTLLCGTIGCSGPVVTVGEADLRVIEYQGHRVVTLAMVDAVHHRARGTARKRFNDNRAHLIQGEDFVKMSASEFRTRFPGVISLRATSDVALMFETGYLMLVKSFTDDLAWQVQRTLVKTYFHHQPAMPKIDYAVGKNDTLTKAEQDQLRNTLTDAAQRLPLEQRGEFLLRGWSKLKSHFRLGKGHTYRNIPRWEFTEALNIVQRHTVEYEPPAQPAAVGHAQQMQCVLDGLVSITSGLTQLLPGLVAVARDGGGVHALSAPPARLLRKSADNDNGTTKRKRA